ncbi:hypothetical protein FRB96_009120 [Tulasnella sp. 330]|nr:hypothetical protein FRB96_009120 [Tulasnella sp. 330]KAG8872464.1 hypothetical protein FRB98_009581 [Tulasnella sp. 332]
MRLFSPFLFLLTTILSYAVAAPILIQQARGDPSFAPRYDHLSAVFIPGKDLRRRAKPHVPAEVSHESIQYVQRIPKLISLLTAPDTGHAQFPTWRVALVDVSRSQYFGGESQEWNRNYPAAAKIFGEGLIPSFIRKLVRGEHKLLHGPAATDITGTLSHGGDLLRLFKDVAPNHQLRPVMYTYIIDNNGAWRFSETGPLLKGLVVDFVSKHAVHANSAPSVRYSGEFHWRPVVKDGWAGLKGKDAHKSPKTQWELVIDNNSGTYAPDKALLSNLKALLEHNFPGLRVVALDQADPALKKSRDAVRQYAAKQTADQPTKTPLSSGGGGWEPTIYLLPLVATHNATVT